MQVELADKYLECHERLCHAVGAKEWDKANDDIKNFLISPEDLIKSLVDVIRGQDDMLKGMALDNIADNMKLKESEAKLNLIAANRQMGKQFTTLYNSLLAPTVKEQDHTYCKCKKPRLQGNLCKTCGACIETGE